MILVTGACGNAGQYVVLKLLENGLDVIAIDYQNKDSQKTANYIARNSKKYKGKFTLHWINFAKMLEGEKNRLEDILKQNKLTGIVHLAFIIPPFSEFNPENSQLVNVDGTRHLIQLAENYAPDAPFVFSSSTTVFGPIAPDETYVDEKHPTSPTSNYTRQKLECEALIKHSKLNWRILRFSAIMNPTFDPHPQAIKFGMNISLTVQIEPVHVKDVVVAVYHALIRPEAAHKIFIISGGSTLQMTYKNYFYYCLIAYLGKVDINDVPWDKFGNHAYFLHWYDTKESQAILEYQSHSMEDFIKDAHKAMAWWKKTLIFIFGSKIALKRFFIMIDKIPS